jgi:glyoxylase-like metal-dependent hydrolase (beta-lactamase superfamily II)
VDFGSWGLGICNYVVYKDDTAIVYDTGNLSQTAQWIRSYLAKKGVQHFIVVLSHWHLDHIVGNPLYSDSTIISLKATREALVKNKAAIEAGKQWGPPAVEVVLPDVTFEDRFEIHLGNLKVQFFNFNIHSRDGNLMYIPADKALFAGDTLEDTVTVIGQPEGIPTHITELKRLRAMNIKQIFPNHGNPDVIKQGGYTKTLIDTVSEYNVNMLSKVRDPGYLDMPIESFIPKALARGVVSIWEPYRIVHERNLKIVHDYWKSRPVPRVT